MTEEGVCPHFEALYSMEQITCPLVTRVLVNSTESQFVAFKKINYLCANIPLGCLNSLNLKVLLIISYHGKA